jgi:hypothetical protein
MNLEGIAIGAGTFLIIGVLHPVVIKTEYHIGTRAWPLFLLAGLASALLSLLISTPVLSPLLAVLGFSLLWSIRELFEQEQRVRKGWYPKNPKKAGDDGVLE